ncbi:hypothetical protein BOSE62_71340 [Bosea sp. 62]|nr:hypothetical protein BOSE21B_90287 [Bosea sp. 21B]CAD5295376.1 hypothetical protein BOSE46_80383 [Bosea sp. 46]CAD5298442.1 hypothetical protein BOSE7B_60378 [Bosea sp. 7B]VVT60933.1 hypothetical protein BOS5A_230210 [Bosea sp. EC-HK365B]VXB35937.1 hypothetical protein BOSE127_110377 [Bosea sp. 127]VXB57888.1 hypothetical protein BOSE125_131130 [Bosea sp. 125]VXC76412.1 hypothetical protein BOSE29B_80273 [Bosea sp. 29B]VXC90273.1 hypothetical protein BOSE62_71340 [Bosea sp. 62]
MHHQRKLRRQRQNHLQPGTPDPHHTARTIPGNSKSAGQLLACLSLTEIEILLGAMFNLNATPTRQAPYPCGTQYGVA